MKKYTKPAVEIEKFTVADIITASGDPIIDPDVGGWGSNSVDEMPAGLEINDEF